MTGSTSVIVIDDDNNVLAQAKSVLARLAVDKIVCVDNVKDGLRALKEQSFDLAIIDIRMPEGGGVELIHVIRDTADRKLGVMPILALCGALSKREESFLSEFEMINVVKKPFIDENFAKEVMASLSLHHIGSAKQLCDTNDHENLVKMVTSAIYSNQTSLARDLIDPKITANPGSPRLNVLLGRILFAEGNLDDAERVSDQVIVANHDYLPALNLKTKILIKYGKFDDALSVMEISQGLSPLNVQRLVGMGEIHLSFGRHLAAKEKFRRALEICPSLDAAKVGLARVAIETGAAGGGRDIIANLEDPSCVVSELNYRGVLLVKAGRVEEGIDLYDKAIGCALDRNVLYALFYNKALAYLKAGNREGARLSIEECLGVRPGFHKGMVLKMKINSKVRFRPIQENIANNKAILTDRQIDILMGHCHVGVKEVEKGGSSRCITYVTSAPSEEVASS